MVLKRPAELHSSQRDNYRKYNRFYKPLERVFQGFSYLITEDYPPEAGYILISECMKNSLHHAFRCVILDTKKGKAIEAALSRRIKS